VIIRNLLSALAPPPTPAAPVPQRTVYLNRYGAKTDSGQKVTTDSARQIATAYRCGNIISDDIATMPLQLFRRTGRNAEQIAPDGALRNMPYLLEVAPNRWQTPFIFKKTIAQWLIFWGNAYIWQPPQAYHELFILPADRTYPVFDADGSLWYQTTFPNNQPGTLPAVEICQLMINSLDGFLGQGVIAYGRETFGRQLAAHQTQNKIMANGLNPSAIMWTEGTLNDEARKKLKDSYLEGMTGSDNAGGVVILDSKIFKLERISMSPTDAQFLEQIQLTDTEICNFFGVPLYKVNAGKQSYDSNSQQDLDYVRTTLNPYLVQWEQAGRLKWIPQAEQGSTYWRFQRNALLWMDAKTRSEVNRNRILSGTMQINEAREVEDMPTLTGGDISLVPSNMAVLDETGKITAISIKTPSSSEEVPQ
jgi:HK97 family phage portal protein